MPNQATLNFERADAMKVASSINRNLNSSKAKLQLNTKAQSFSIDSLRQAVSDADRIIEEAHDKANKGIMQALANLKES